MALEKVWLVVEAELRERVGPNAATMWNSKKWEISYEKKAAASPDLDSFADAQAPGEVRTENGSGGFLRYIEDYGRTCGGAAELQTLLILTGRVVVG